MNKEGLIATLREQQISLVHEFQEKISTLHSLVDVDELDTLDPEDFSHQFESGEMEQLMRVHLKNAKHQLDALDSIDFSLKSTVREGACVVTDHFTCIIAFASPPFKYDGKIIIGISKDSPIYAAMMGLKEGDQFNCGGNSHRILQII